MEEVPVPRVINREEQPEDPVTVAATAGYVVREGRRVVRAVTDRGRERVGGEGGEGVEQEEEDGEEGYGEECE